MSSPQQLRWTCQSPSSRNRAAAIKVVSAATTAAVANLCAQTAAAIWKERNEENEAGPVRKAPSSLFTMAVSPGTVALVACGLLQSLVVG
jgi:hypothetical protein